MSDSYYATLDTVIYGLPYNRGQLVDTEDWVRTQVLQMLGLGLIAPQFYDPSQLVYTYTQDTPSASWAVEHNLGRYVCVDVYVENQLGLADVEIIDLNNLAITFPEATSGVATMR